jgi:tetratricopeptide (TPR) repeat protein
MKHLYLLALSLVLWNVCYCQTESFDTLLNRGKSQFKSDLKRHDYNYAITCLTKAIQLNPNSAEAHYYLGYAFSRLNSKDASTVPRMQMSLVLKTSEEMGKVISLTPLYKGEIVSLDPYSKITSEWGSLAFSYLANNKLDSAKWAFREGKKRGGYDKFILAINRAVINSCSKNSILISSGDNYTYPLYYLQLIEKLRPDVSVVDISLPNTVWYPKLMENMTSIKFGIKEPALDTLNYTYWVDSTISIPIYQTKRIFSWTLKPSYQEHYILRGDRILLSMLQENKFERDVYFTKGQISSEQLSLGNYLLILPLLDKINAKNESPEPIEQFIDEFKKIFSTFKPVNSNSQAELTPIDIFRWGIIDKMKNIEGRVPVGQSKLYKLLTDYIPLKEYPCYDKNMIEYLRAIGIK